MQLVDYANIACGFHAGDYNTMVRTVRAAKKYGVKMGAHPGLDDIKGFGRRKIDVTPDDIYASTLYQLGALKAIIEAEAGTFSHVKVSCARCLCDDGSTYSLISSPTACSSSSSVIPSTTCEPL